MNANVCYVKRCFAFALLTCGVALDPNHKKYEITYTICFLTAFVSGGLSAFVGFFKLASTTAERLDFVYTINAVISGLLIFTVTQTHRKLLITMNAKMNEFCRRSTTFVDISNKLFADVVAQYYAIVFYTYVTVTVIPLVTTYMTNVEAGHVKSLIFPSWYPWNMKSHAGYAWTMIVQLASLTWGYSMVAGVVASLFSSMVSLFAFVCIFEDRMRLACRQLTKTTIAYVGENTTNRPPAMPEQLVEVVDLHRLIITYAHEIVKYFSYSSITLVSAVFVSALLLISVYFKITDDYLYKVKLISASIIITSALFMYCYAGDLLYELNRRIINVIYDMPWYEMSPEIRKIFITMILFSQKDFKLRAYKCSWIRADFFMHMAKVCYSAVQIITA